MKEEDDLSYDAALRRVFYALEERERSVLMRIAKRLLEGQILFGALTKGKYNWRKEAQEEAMDMAVYLSAMMEDHTNEK